MMTELPNRTELYAASIYASPVQLFRYFCIGEKYCGKTVTGIKSVIGFQGVCVEYDDLTTDEFLYMPYILYRRPSGRRRYRNGERSIERSVDKVRC
jgi:hypothetical protein